MTVKRVLSRSVVFTLLIVLSVVWLFPLVSVLVTVSKNSNAYDNLAFWHLPAARLIGGNILGNVYNALLKSGLAHNFFNSVIYAVASGAGSAFVAAMGAYALVHLEIRRSQLWFLFLFVGNLFPFQMFLIPLYLLLNGIGLYDTRGGLIIVYVGICVPFALFVTRNYAYTMPKELFDAGKVDGATDWVSFYRIFLPLAVPALAVAFIFQFIWTWNDLVFGLVLSENQRPIMTALAKLSGLRGGVAEPTLIAGAIVAAVPALFIILGLQRYFVRGFTISVEK